MRLYLAPSVCKRRLQEQSQHISEKKKNNFMVQRSSRNGDLFMLRRNSFSWNPKPIISLHFITEPNRGPLHFSAYPQDLRHEDPSSLSRHKFPGTLTSI